MHSAIQFLLRFAIIALALSVAASYVLAQQARGTLRGVVKDEFGALIAGATVTVTDASDRRRTATTSGEGIYTFDGLVAGRYGVSALANGFATSVETPIEVQASQRSSLDITLKVTIAEQRVTVQATTPISTEVANNADQIVVGGKDLDALPDDPAELAAALTALAGPPVGPGAAEIFVDGFSEGTVPPKSSIREVRINQNPFAAENDQPSTRTDIFTKPGTDKFHGGGFFNYNDESLNSRNPFAAHRTPFQIRHFGGNFSGPIVARKASFFFNGEHLVTDDNELVRASVLDANLHRLDEGFGVLVPRRSLNFSPRLDYQLNESNTLVARYLYYHQSTENSGVSGFSLPERAYNSLFTFQNLQLTETAVLGPAVINEARFQYNRARSESLGDTTKPTLSVSGAFTGGGSQVG